jgi:biopolymer transport protein ExbD
MADNRRFLDVWIIESNTVYREVPYNVVADWIQQGRLLEGDQLKASGSTEWFPLASMPAFAAYLPRSERFRAEDQAEALEPVEVDFAWKQPRPDEDEDVDMIPLIDVSLVLLIFFMMTTTVAGAGALIKTPFAINGSQLTSEDRHWIGIERTDDGRVVYSLGKGDGGAAEGDRQLTQQEVISKLEARLRSGKPINVHIRGARSVPYRYVEPVLVALSGFQDRGLIRRTYVEVTSKENP